MTPKRRVLATLTKPELLDLANAFGVDGTQRTSLDDLRDALGRSKRASLAAIAPELTVDALKRALAALDLPTNGAPKSGLVERILAAASSANGDTEPDPAPLALASPTPAPPRRHAAPAPRRASGDVTTDDYRHDATRKNNPPAGLLDHERPPEHATKHYAYDPHLDPQLQWSGKSERTSFDVDTVSLHIHERVSTQAILRAVKREDAQRSLFAESDLPESKQIDFYQHDVGWSNRLVLGDSLLVMNSLLEREHMAGKVQCIYMDPPYGVKFNSNFQPSISRRDVKDGDDASLTREPEQIQAYRDTWTLGVHSYLTYMRDRLLLARELLHESGSVFVQISDENVHHVRELMDEVFGGENFAGQIVVAKTSGLGTSGLKSIADYLIWYARRIEHVKYRKLFRDKIVGVGEGSGGRYDQLVGPDHIAKRPVTPEERADPGTIPPGWRAFQLSDLTSAAFRENTTVPYTFEGETFHPGMTSCWKTTVEGLDRLASVGRIAKAGRTIRYVRFIDDFPAYEITNVWADVAGALDKLYVVQTSPAVVQRCLLMTTEPGDLVLDPTCGSGTTAFVAEQWGRRWITCDTSRVALTLARQRLLTSKFQYYRLRSTRVRDGFHYKTVAHVTLGSIAQNPRIDTAKTRAERERIIRESAEQESLFDQPEEDRSRIRVSGPFTVEAIPVASLEDPNDSPIAPLEPEARDDDIARAGRGTGATSSAAEYVDMMIELVKKTGVAFPTGKTLTLPSLRPVKGGFEYLHAESETGNPGDPRRVAVSFGPRHAPVTPVQVLRGISETRGYDIVLFIGFACDPEARRVIDQPVHGRELHFAAAAPDILVGDKGLHLLKASKTTKLFTVFGAPDVKVHRENGGSMVSMELLGVDLYDPNTGETTHGKGNEVAAWFVDHDYDGRTFCICQALFPSGGTKNPWEKLQKALKGTIDEEKFEQLRTTRSLPFKPGKRVAVTVIDDRGNEVIKVVQVGG